MSDSRSNGNYPDIRELHQGFWIYLYFRIRLSFAHLRPVILSSDWSICRLQSWTCSSLPTVAEFVKLTQSIGIEIQRQSADLYKVQLCSQQFFVGVPAIYVVKVYECHPLDCTYTLLSWWLDEICSCYCCITFVPVTPTSPVYLIQLSLECHECI